MHRALRPVSALVPVALGYYVFHVYRSTSGLKQSFITVGNSAPLSFLKSESYTVINPKGHDGSHDTRTVVIELPAQKASSSDEQILSDFTDGLFGGWVFAPERWVLRSLHRKLVGFSKFPNFENAESIWAPQQLSRRRLPSLGSILFGTFQVIDVSITSNDGNDSGSISPPSESYVDIGFGSDRFRFAGFHRFSVGREQTVQESHGSDEASSAIEDTSTSIRITFSAFACNPSTNRPSGSGFLRAFHKAYAILLFREGVARVLQP